VGAFIGSTAQGTGITTAGLGVLRLLAARDGLKSSEVAARGWWTPGTVTSVVDTLVRDGYVERRREAADRRVVRLHITDTGRRKVEEAIMLIGPKWQDAFGYLDPAEEPVIRKFLIETIDRFGTLIREERGQSPAAPRRHSSQPRRHQAPPRHRARAPRSAPRTCARPTRPPVVTCPRCAVST